MAEWVVKSSKSQNPGCLKLKFNSSLQLTQLRKTNHPSTHPVSICLILITKKAKE